jgi:hypothetical protein
LDVFKFYRAIKRTIHAFASFPDVELVKFHSTHYAEIFVTTEIQLLCHCFCLHHRNGFVITVFFIVRKFSTTHLSFANFTEMFGTMKACIHVRIPDVSQFEVARWAQAAALRN